MAPLGFDTGLMSGQMKSVGVPYLKVLQGRVESRVQRGLVGMVWTTAEGN